MAEGKQARNFKKYNLKSEEYFQVKGWVDHARDYMDKVLGPRCETIMSEVAIGVNWQTGEVEVLPDVENREYPERPGWRYGTADLVCVLKTGDLLVGDWKTGGTEGAEEQLLSLGVCFQKCMLIGEDSGDGSVGVRVRPLRTLCLQVDDNGVWPKEYVITQEQISNHWDAMMFADQDIEVCKEPVPGIHCTQLYCPHLAYCSAVTGMVVDAAREDGKQPDGTPLIAPDSLMRQFRLTDSPRSSEEAGQVMAVVGAARRQLKYYDAAIKAYVNKGGTVTQGKYEWIETPTQGFRWRRVKK